MAAASQRRIHGISISKPIIYGNYADPVTDSNPLPPGAPKDHSHTWTLFVKDATGQDLSLYVKKVVFKLHETYPNSTRTVEKPPFELRESGWGEFEVAIRIYFNSVCGERSLTLYHNLKLHPFPASSDPASIAQPAVSKVGRVESVLYDEIVFNEPTEKMFRLLTSVPGSLLPYNSNETVFTKEHEREELDRIDKATRVIQRQLDKRTKEFKELEVERQRLLS
ncbi:DEKNAAC103647 [Brettanomyces naardenensis]|uniref:Protein AF-9 homolog n=1 Tax=Brettanomyces naardenensis TaxID=13370 RepID=A0A448YNY8_BRENA|nr:DEKNAAC103647 [Brettanomyces naardenensis]